MFNNLYRWTRYNTTCNSKLNSDFSQQLLTLNSPLTLLTIICISSQPTDNSRLLPTDSGSPILLIYHVSTTSRQFCCLIEYWGHFIPSHEGHNSFILLISHTSTPYRYCLVTPPRWWLMLIPFSGEGWESPPRGRGTRLEHSCTPPPPRTFTKSLVQSHSQH